VDSLWFRAYRVHTATPPIPCSSSAPIATTTTSADRGQSLTGTTEIAVLQRDWTSAATARTCITRTPHARRRRGSGFSNAVITRVQQRSHNHAVYAAEDRRPQSPPASSSSSQWTQRSEEVCPPGVAAERPGATRANPPPPPPPPPLLRAGAKKRGRERRYTTPNSQHPTPSSQYTALDGQHPMGLASQTPLTAHCHHINCHSDIYVLFVVFF
jgi:hypothetical protein